MAIYVHILFWICIYTCLFTEGAEYYISTSINTWNNVPQDCNLAQPEYVHEYATGTINLNNSIPLNETQQHDVWIGYFKALTEFKYHGCSNLSISDLTHVKSLVDCKYACSGNYFGLYCSDDELQCQCLNELPDVDDLKSKYCTTLDDFVCGTNSRLAIYSVGTDKSSRNQNIISNLCKASPFNSNYAAWIKCDDENNATKVWCRNDESSEPFLSSDEFAAWNEANDDCANKDALPSTAVGYNGDNLEDMAFTNIFRSWTTQKGNGSCLFTIFVRPFVTM
ncbi:uncharacterized protein LOC127860691 [Dreissena polymorpha]|uniref:Uncharacterized protein n=1 Tax=Dreissena polymorpha TaxID=45954 RepID=A0A9D4BRS0_DREPO|nr:uncharacterized protein LOC127860691 [Dreissena polymorpha]KAH3702917.1 hypothetical protein DPMN_077944 [Dreissena polymorpha]